MNRIGDLHTLETADGKLLVIGEEVTFPVYGGYGAPPTEWITRRGYKQHGATEIDYILGSRSLSIEFLYAHATDRQNYWDNRFRLHQFLRPNRGGPLKLTLYTDNGSQRSLYIRATPGLGGPDETDNNWHIRERIDFTAFDPIWFDPTSADITLESAAENHLIFPITFPIQFGAGGLHLSTGTITYTGTWKSYPTITLYGPYNVAIITNIQTNAAIEMTTGINSTETRTITLTPGSQSVVSGSGLDTFNELGPASNLIDFNLRPDPELADGQQEITVNFVGGMPGVTGAEISYNNRYFAI